MIKKQMYEAPEIEVLELRMEGAVLTVSNPEADAESNEGMTWGGGY